MRRIDVIALSMALLAMPAFAQNAPSASSTAPVTSSQQPRAPSTPPTFPTTTTRGDQQGSTAQQPRADDDQNPQLPQNDRGAVPEQTSPDQNAQPEQQKQPDADRPPDVGVPPANPDQVTGLPPATQGDRNTAPDRDALASRIEKRIQGALPNTNVSATRTNGQIVLTGTVNSVAEKARAEQIASDAANGLKVQNNITVARDDRGITPPPQR